MVWQCDCIASNFDNNHHAASTNAYANNNLSARAKNDDVDDVGYFWRHVLQTSVRGAFVLVRQQHHYHHSPNDAV
jgi:hypothetical protein